MNEKEFETYWNDNREKILNSNSEYRSAKETYKSMSGADYMLFGIPIVTGIVFMDNCTFIQHEILRWIATAVIVIICFVLCVWVKVLYTGSKSPYEIEKKIKEHIREELLKTDKKP